MDAHVRFKNEFTEDEQYHILMRWLQCLEELRYENSGHPLLQKKSEFWHVLDDLLSMRYVVQIMKLKCHKY